MPSATAASMAATISAALPSSPTSRIGRDGERLVVAEIRARSDARKPGTTGRRRVRISGSDAGDVGRMTRLKGIERLPRVLPGGSGRRKCPCHDHLRGRIGDLSSGEARRHRVAGRREVGVPLVDAVVDDRDLHPLTLVREAGLPRRPGGRAGCGVGRGARVRRARVDLLDAREGSQQGQGGGRAQRRPLR